MAPKTSARKATTQKTGPETDKDQRALAKSAGEKQEIALRTLKTLLTPKIHPPASAPPSTGASSSLPDLNPFFPIDPTLKGGQQTSVNAIPPTDAEELRWREVSRRFAPRRY
jgi:hypothetical protein